MSYKLLYQQGHDPDQIFILQSGEVIFFASNDDRYRISGNNIILGSTEIILSHLLSLPTKRLETAVVSEKAQISCMSSEKFLSQFKHEKYLLNMGKVIAQKIRLTNSIIKKNQNILLSGKKTLKQLYLQYFSIVSIIIDEYNKRKLPWLKDIVAKYSTSISFLKAEAYTKADVPVKIFETTALSDRTIDLPPDYILCKEGNKESDMFILQSGTLEVSVNNNRVAILNEAGTTIGEIALLLGEVRSATIRSLTPIRVTKLRLKDLKEIAKNDIDTIVQIIYSLTKKFYNNINLIRDINMSVMNKTLSEEAGEKGEKIEISNISHELNKLKYELGELLYAQNADFIRSRLTPFM
ncbi:MAG: cyclic nucleotide-binding domain-containing protein [Spirochaetes bacterium]|jgi:CRP-like cAMP-binding protein|nr:cyclic nucleotide-binding domain-containing protein [Spirochaetota bacterium]